MRRIAIRGGKFAIVDDRDYARLTKNKWHLHSAGYAVRCSKNRQRALMHREVVRARPGTTVDHIDRNTLNNRRSNLRVCSHQANLYNRGATSKSLSGVRGVWWSNRDQRWIVSVGASFKSKTLAKRVAVAARGVVMKFL